MAQVSGRVASDIVMALYSHGPGEWGMASDIVMAYIAHGPDERASGVWYSYGPI